MSGGFTGALEPEDIKSGVEHLEKGGHRGSIDRDDYSIDFYDGEKDYLVVEMDKARLEYREPGRFQQDFT
ncbi:MAG: hypothetical protein ABEJ99_01895 [Candidatus Nanohaloarchaea archaeon]